MTAPKKSLQVIAPPLPKGVVHAKMCKRCPFRPDGSGYAQDHPDLPGIIETVELGFPFYCHETGILDKRTTLDAAGEEPSPRFQPHFELCRGGHEHHMAKWRERVIAAGCLPGEEAPLPKAPLPEPSSPSKPKPKRALPRRTR